MKLITLDEATKKTSALKTLTTYNTAEKALCEILANREAITGITLSVMVAGGTRTVSIPVSFTRDIFCEFMEEVTNKIGEESEKVVRGLLSKTDF